MNEALSSYGFIEYEEGVFWAVDISQNKMLTFEYVGNNAQTIPLFTVCMITWTKHCPDGYVKKLVVKGKLKRALFVAQSIAIEELIFLRKRLNG